MALRDTGARSGGGIYPDQIGTPPFSSDVAQNYPSADGLLCGFWFLSYLEPRSSADCAQLRATRSTLNWGSGLKDCFFWVLNRGEYIFGYFVE